MFDIKVGDIVEGKMAGFSFTSGGGYFKGVVKEVDDYRAYVNVELMEKPKAFANSTANISIELINKICYRREYEREYDE